MAHSIQSVGERFEILKDLDLLILTGMMVQQVKAKPDRFASLQDFAEGWHRCRTSYGPGCIHLALDQIASDASTKTEFLDLLSEVERRLAVLGPRLDAATVNRCWGVRGVEFYDCETSRLVSPLQKLRALVEGG